MTETHTKGSALLRRWLNDNPNIKQSTLAADLGVTPGMVSLLATGRARPSLDLACLIQARTRAMVRVTDWLDGDTQARREYIARASEIV
jgi:transcriptional regulator with XRE-family HTH domain